MTIKVLRLGHRKKRDPRLTTHVCLTARALGADEVFVSGEQDDSTLKSVRAVVENWGGKLKISYEKSWRKVIVDHKKKKFDIVHLSIYGEPLQNKIEKIRKIKKLLLIVGGEKVPGEVYKLVDFNISVTQQPHSEVAALAILLHDIFQGEELKKKFKNAKIRVVPQEKGKKIIKRD